MLLAKYLCKHSWQVWVNALSHTSDTNVDHKPVVDKILLKDNDLIEIGQRKFIFHSLEPGSAKVAAHEPACFALWPWSFVLALFSCSLQSNGLGC